jgi:phenylpyruvate tautomerase PptA (4-oxalocrotonate tautomerase family)
MPLVRIDVRQGKSTHQLGRIVDGVHRALVETISVPALDKFQVVTEHPPERLIADAEYLGIRRSEGVVLIQITISQGRTVEQKKALFAAIAKNLTNDADVRPEDVFVNLLEVPKENWSFGNGIAQYAT